MPSASRMSESSFSTLSLSNKKQRSQDDTKNKKNKSNLYESFDKSDRIQLVKDLFATTVKEILQPMGESTRMSVVSDVREDLRTQFGMDNLDNDDRNNTFELDNCESFETRNVENGNNVLSLDATTTDGSFSRVPNRVNDGHHMFAGPYSGGAIIGYCNLSGRKNNRNVPTIGMFC